MVLDESSMVVAAGFGNNRVFEAKNFVSNI